MSKTVGQNQSQNTLLFDKEILRIDEVVQILGHSKSHIYRLTSQKKIPFRKKGKTLFFMSKEILDWVNQGVA